MRKKSGPFDFRIIVKCTRRCNFRCQYCTDKRDGIENDMPFEVLAAIHHKLGEMKDTKNIQIIWHGGEPLLLGIKFFEKALFLQQKMLSPNQSITNVIQSNASLIDESYAKFFKMAGFHFGISLDGPPEIHNRNRRLCNGEDSYELTTRGISLLEREGLSYGILTVLNWHALEYGPAKMWEFYKEHNFKRFGLLSLRKAFNNDAEFRRYNKRYGKFMSELFYLWMKEDDKEIKIREYLSKLDMFLGLPSRLCRDGGPCVGKYFGIEPDGTIYHCDKFVGKNRWKLGNVMTDSFMEFMHSDKIELLKKHEKEIRKRCINCEWHHLCRGGCLSDTIDLTQADANFGTDDCVQYMLYKTIGEFLAKSPPIIQKVIDELTADENVPCVNFH